MLHPDELSRLVNGNDPPNAVESASVRQDLNSLRTQIAQLEATLEGLRQRERARLAILSSVRRIPDEILGEIFLLALPPVLDEMGRDALLGLSLVCRRWRSACLATHRLWGGIKIFLYHAGRISYDKIAAWLGRAGAMPKTVEIRTIFGCRCPDMPCHSANPALRRLVTEGPPLEHLKLPCKDASCFRNWVSAVQAVQGQTPTWDLLKSLHLTFGEEARWNDANKASRSIFRHLPLALTSLHLQLPPGRAAFRSDDEQLIAVLHIPSQILQQLKSLAIFCDWWGMHIFDMLEQCANLEILQVDIDDRVPSEDLDATDELELRDNPLKLAKLHTLRFRRAATIEFLDYIRAPALRHLDLACSTAEREDDEDEDFAHTLQDFIVQSRIQNKLETLRIYDAYVPAEALGRALSKLRTLRQLTLDRLQMDDPKLFWMQFWDTKSAPGADEGGCLPFLERLDLLNLPAIYPFSFVADFLAENKKRVPCQVTISYQAGGQYTTGDFDELYFRKARASFKVVPPEPLDEGYYEPCLERDFV
ncbi:hypothetical protein NMY22_g2801 [Coprinellus aureogranulatus]|nr:hypothetical protein NMY22_g2801 [Coprinellus aureogranulatus]